MRTPDATLIRARARAPLRDLQALHLSSAGIECIRHLETNVRSLRSLYADDNRLKDIEGLLTLRRLWHIDLSGNLLHGVHGGASLLSPLASFTALGFLYLERNQLEFQDLACLRDVHIMELRVQDGNPALLRNASRGDRGSASAIEGRMKIVALLPNVWVLNGHYIAVTERQQALDEFDGFAQILLEELNGGGDSSSSGACDKFGSTAKLWGGAVHEDAFGRVHHHQNDNVTRLVERIDTKRVRSAELEDRYRLRTIVSLHNEECSVHNAHCRFAPSKLAPNARAMAQIPLPELLAASRRIRIEVAALLAAHLEFGFARELLVEALVIALLECGSVSAEELGALPPYAMAALLGLLRHRTLEEDATLEDRSDQVDQLKLWTSMPPLFTTHLHIDMDGIAASFPDNFHIVKRRGAADAPGLQSAAQLLQLVQSASALGAKVTDAGPSRTARKPRVGEWVEVRPKQFIRVTQVSDDGTHVVALSPTDASESIALRIDHLSRVSSSLWRVGDRESAQLRLGPELSRSASSLGKLHRDSEGFHRHGAARNQGFPNQFVTSRDLEEMERLASDNQHGQMSLSESAEQNAQPVTLFTSNDTVDANFVLAPPQLVSAQNYLSRTEMKIPQCHVVLPMLAQK
ncbi:hypothetical protein PybrP1_001734 [[Pythium] brassicae (nom. inval.)]|nr:hypothetical protein PybrP1_001734 [[Pythium] brassicae (nom. inval.)]